MREFDRIKDMVYNELDNLSAQGKLSKETVCIIGELVDILKDIGTVEMFEEGVQGNPDDEYSFATGSSYQRNRYYNDNGRSYRGGSSYRRGGYSRDDSKEHMIEKLEQLMHEAQDEKDKKSIEKLIHQMEG